MERSKISSLLSAVNSGKEVLVYGWVKTLRNSGSVSFIQINDGSCLSDIQVVVEDVPEELEVLSQVSTGASVEVSGILVESLGKGQAYDIHANSIKVLGVSNPDEYPLQKKRHTLEFLRDIAHLRPRTNTFGAMSRVRNSAAFAIHSFFQERGFQYIQTPMITASDAEGAGSMFRVTTLDLANVPKKSGVPDLTEDFFGKSAYLTVSGQLEAEIFAQAVSDVYTFGPTFRAENSNTSRHLAEFWMVEPEVAFCDLSGLADLAEDFLKNVFGRVLARCPEDMAFFNQWYDKTTLSTLENIIDSDFERIIPCLEN